MKNNGRTARIAGMIVLASLYLAGCVSFPATTEPEDMQDTFFVKAGGSNRSDGRSEKAAFGTLRKALEAAAAGPVKTVTVIGTLNGLAEVTGTGSEEILITGQPGARLVNADRGRVLITHGNTNIRIENLTITGSTGIAVNDGSKLTLGAGAVIANDNKQPGASYAILGGGVLVQTGGVLIMESGALITGNRAMRGGGVCVLAGTFIMGDTAALRENDAVLDGENKRGTGGALYAEDSVVEIGGNAVIAGNIAYFGGGIYAWNTELRLKDEASLRGNGNYLRSDPLYGGSGGALFINSGTVVLADRVSILENFACWGGAVFVTKESTLIVQGTVHITNNQAIYHEETQTGGLGGGLLVRGALFLGDNAQISGNYANILGDDLYLVQGASCSVNDSALIYSQYYEETQQTTTTLRFAD
jgi:hypothetical protein